VPNTATAGTVEIRHGQHHTAGSATIQAQEGSIRPFGREQHHGRNRRHSHPGRGQSGRGSFGGNINAGSNPNGYTFSASANYSVSALLGGISTAAGGNVNISAGGNVTSFLPTATSSSVSDAGSGAFGPEPGVVTVTAGGDIAGHFVAADSARNGNPVASTVNAGGDAGTSSGLLALSLVTGGWQVMRPMAALSPGGAESQRRVKRKIGWRRAV